VVGIYPMLADESCFFLAADFDRESWHEDTLAFLDVCGLMGVPAVLERSRSGNGGHVWIFFTEAVPAVLARKMGTYLLTETMERRPDLGLDLPLRAGPSVVSETIGTTRKQAVFPGGYHCTASGETMWSGDHSSF